MDPSKQLLDYSLRHQISLSRYGSKVVRDILALLNDADKEILAKILKRGEDGSFTKARLDKLLVELRATSKEAYALAHNELQTAMLEFSVHEAEQTAKVLSSLTTPPATRAEAISLVRKLGLELYEDADILAHEAYRNIGSIAISAKTFTGHPEVIVKTDVGVIGHELGHEFWDQLKDNNPAAKNKWVSIIDGLTDSGRDISPRAASNYAESMAESLGAMLEGNSTVLPKEVTDFVNEHYAEWESSLTGVGAPVTPASINMLLSITQPTAEQLAAIVSKAPITVGADKKLLLEEIFESLAAGKEEAIRGAIRLGMVEGETVPEIVRRLQGSRASRYTDGIFEKDRRNAEAIVRTVVNHTSNQAVQLTYQANSDIVQKWEFLATLDNRTTLICASLSGTKWPIGDGPLPPRHVRCRSFQLPVLATWKELGFDMDEMPTSYRSSKDGPVAADITFDKWLKGQDVSTQKDILGATRQKLFASGELKIDRFTDRAGVVYDLPELKKRNEAAFKKVFG